MVNDEIYGPSVRMLEFCFSYIFDNKPKITEDVIQNVVHIHSINLGMEINVRNHVRITGQCFVHAQSRLCDGKSL